MADAQVDEAGRAWGARAAEWATLMEPFNIAVFRDVVDKLAPRPGEALVDVACGAGLALTEAARRGCDVAGIDAAAGLIEIARERLPHADLQVGDMCALPWAESTFDVATSFNGVWNVELAIAELARVLTPGGRFGLSSWGSFASNDLATVLAPAMINHAPPEVLESGLTLGASSEPGVFEQLCSEHGLTVNQRGVTDTVFEFADTERCAHACLSAGPLWGAVERAGEATVLAALTEAAAAFVSPATGMVRLRFQWSWVTGLNDFPAATPQR